MTEDRALFRSIEECLMWAFYFAQHEANTVEEPTFSTMIAKDDREQLDERPRTVHPFSEPTAPKPRGYDGAAQAGLIKSFLEGLPDDERYHLKAISLRTHERTNAQRQMRGIVVKMLEGRLINGLVYELVAKHYGKRYVTMLGLAKKYHVDRRKATHVFRQVEITLDAIGYRAEMHAYTRLQSMGVVQ